MNNEPVGKVVQYDKNGSLEHAWFGEPPPVGTLLYTHPVKELTDEEIKSEAKYFCHSWHSQNPERLVLFARAILRKAQDERK